MKKVDFYIQILLFATAFLLFCGKVMGLQLAQSTITLWVALGLWQLVSAILLLFSPYLSYATRSQVQTYWLMVALGFSIHMASTYIPICAAYAFYIMYCMIALYYLKLTYKLAFYRRTKALW